MQSVDNFIDESEYIKVSGNANMGTFVHHLGQSFTFVYESLAIVEVKIISKNSKSFLDR